MAALRCLLLLLCGAALGPAVHLDFAEHRSQAAKIKVNPRGNLWATGSAGPPGAERLGVRGREWGCGVQGGGEGPGVVPVHEEVWGGLWLCCHLRWWHGTCGPCPQKVAGEPEGGGDAPW